MSPLEQWKLFLNRRGWGRNCRSKSYRRRWTGAGETTPSAKGLSCKHQDLSFTPEPMWEKALRQIHPSTEGTETGDAWSSLATSLTYLSSFRCVRERLYLNGKVDNVWGITPGFVLWSPMHTHTRTCTYTQTQAKQTSKEKTETTWCRESLETSRCIHRAGVCSS